MVSRWYFTLFNCYLQVPLTDVFLLDEFLALEIGSVPSYQLQSSTKIEIPLVYFIVQMQEALTAMIIYCFLLPC